jgi:hypothetical protein
LCLLFKGDSGYIIVATVALIAFETVTLSHPYPDEGKEKVTGLFTTVNNTLFNNDKRSMAKCQ